MDIRIIRADITSLPVEAIVNPANSLLTMGGGAAGAIKKRGGENIMHEAKQHAPLAIGKAIVTQAGRLPSTFVIHAPTMEKPSQQIPTENIRKAMKAILETAAEYGIKEVATPGLGTGVGGIDADEAATIMVEVIRSYDGKLPKKVVLVALTEDLFQAYERALRR